MINFDKINFKIDKYYKGLTIIGIILTYFGLNFLNKYILVQGLVTIVYGIIIWTFFSGFGIEADIKTPKIEDIFNGFIKVGFTMLLFYITISVFTILKILQM